MIWTSLICYPQAHITTSLLGTLLLGCLTDYRESIWCMIHGPLAPLCSEIDSHWSSVEAMESRTFNFFQSVTVRGRDKKLWSVMLSKCRSCARNILHFMTVHTTTSITSNYSIPRALVNCPVWRYLKISEDTQYSKSFSCLSWDKHFLNPWRCVNIIFILLVLQMNCHWYPSPWCYGHAFLELVVEDSKLSLCWPIASLSVSSSNVHNYHSISAYCESHNR